MKYDNHTITIEKMVLHLHDLEPKDYVTYEDLTSQLKIEKLELERILKNYEYSFLFETECLCSRNKGSSTEDMFLLSIEAERLIAESNSWKGWLMCSHKKPLKLYSKWESIRNIYTPLKIIILTIYSILVTSISLWLGYKAVSNEQMNNIDSKTIQALKDSTETQRITINKLNKQLKNLKK